MKTGQVPCSARPRASGEIFGAHTEDSPTTTFEIKRCAGFPTRPHKSAAPNGDVADSLDEAKAAFRAAGERGELNPPQAKANSLDGM
jgi:hypothetical protein